MLKRLTPIWVIVTLATIWTGALLGQDDAVKKFTGRDYLDFWQAGRDLMGRAAPASSLKLREGFRAELLYTVPIQEQGTWVSMTVDPQGRLIVSAEHGRLHRITLPPVGGDSADTKIELLDIKIGAAQGLLFAFNSLYVVVNSEGSSGLYRVRDTDGDDQFDEVKLLRRLLGSGDHGPHAVVAGPEGKYLYLIAGNEARLPSIDRSLGASQWREDRLLFSTEVAAGLLGQSNLAGKFSETNPGGWVCRTDPAGKTFELVSSGFRNAYDLAFNHEGELFTYDSDNEGEVGMPWYRPTRVNHVVSGGEFGWREMIAKLPSDYVDSCGAVVNIGRGSPTGATFGTGAKFPAKYQRALFVGDWSHGNIFATHLTPEGASYRAELEPFVSGAPLPVADLLIHPTDGALYFLVGGRRVTSALYRVTYTGTESTGALQPVADDFYPVRLERRRLEALHGRNDAATLEIAWPYLAHADRSLRYAARVAVEHQKLSAWQARALVERDPRAAIAAVVALARVGGTSAERMGKVLDGVQWDTLSVGDRVDLLRAYALVLSRSAVVGDEVRAAIIGRLNPHFPSNVSRLDRELAEILAYLQAPKIISRTLGRLEAVQTQEEQIHYATCLLTIKDGWSLDERRQYFRWFARANAHRGGVSLGGFVGRLKWVAASQLSDQQRETLSPELQEAFRERPTEDSLKLEKRAVVKQWSVEDVVGIIDTDEAKIDLQRGHAVFASALCYRCHRLAEAGGTGGPDLTTVGKRFGVREIVEAIVDPNRVISDQYRMAKIILDDGKIVTAKVSDVAGDRLLLVNDPLNFTMSTLDRNRVDEIVPSDVSMMPSGLLDRFTANEVRDLVAFLRSRGVKLDDSRDN